MNRESPLTDSLSLSDSARLDNGTVFEQIDQFGHPIDLDSRIPREKPAFCLRMFNKGIQTEESLGRVHPKRFLFRSHPRASRNLDLIHERSTRNRVLLFESFESKASVDAHRRCRPIERGRRIALSSGCLEVSLSLSL